MKNLILQLEIYELTKNINNQNICNLIDNLNFFITNTSIKYKKNINLTNINFRKKYFNILISKVKLLNDLQYNLLYDKDIFEIFINKFNTYVYYKNKKLIKQKINYTNLYKKDIKKIILDYINYNINDPIFCDIINNIGANITNTIIDLLPKTNINYQKKILQKLLI